MKELSIEEKARLYDEAIKRAREFVCKDNVEVAEYIFPELKESEDWIPKEIIKYLKEKGDFRSCWIAWLERQGEKESIVLKFREGDVIEYKSKQWTIIGVDLDNHCYDMSNDECVDFDTAYYAFKLVEKKPAWSEKDEEIIIKIGEYLNRYGNYIVESNEEKAADVYKSADWLKSLKDRANLKNVELISNKK